MRHYSFARGIYGCYAAFMSIRIPPLDSTHRIREYNKYNDDIRAAIVFNWLTGRMSDRQMNDNFIPDALPTDNGRVAMNIREYLGLKAPHKRYFTGKTEYQILEELESAAQENPDFILLSYYFRLHMKNSHSDLDYSQSSFASNEYLGKDFLMNTLLYKVSDNAEIDHRLLSLPDVEGKDKKTITIKNEEIYVRNRDVRESIKSLYDYRCQICNGIIYKIGWSQEFDRKQRWKFLSADLHHIHALSKGGPDIKANAVCLCPNCHRKLHTGEFRLVNRGNNIICKNEVLGGFSDFKTKHLIDLSL